MTAKNLPHNVNRARNNDLKQAQAYIEKLQDKWGFRIALVYKRTVDTDYSYYGTRWMTERLKVLVETHSLIMPQINTDDEVSIREQDQILRQHTTESIEAVQELKPLNPADYAKKTFGKLRSLASNIVARGQGGGKFV